MFKIFQPNLNKFLLSFNLNFCGEPIGSMYFILSECLLLSNKKFVLCKLVFDILSCVYEVKIRFCGPCLQLFSHFRIACVVKLD